MLRSAHTGSERVSAAFAKVNIANRTCPHYHSTREDQLYWTVTNGDRSLLTWPDLLRGSINEQETGKSISHGISAMKKMVLEKEWEVLMLALLEGAFKERGSKSQLALLKTWGGPTRPEQGEWSEEIWGWASLTISTSYVVDLRVYSEGDRKHRGGNGMTWILLP